MNIPLFTNIFWLLVLISEILTNIMILNLKDKPCNIHFIIFI
jgi:hypothetical protein